MLQHPTRLLKMLEEPPPGTTFLAVSDQLDAVLPTILSRCVLLRAPIPSRTQSLAWLQIDRRRARRGKAGGSGRRAARTRRRNRSRSTPGTRPGAARGADQVVELAARR